MPKVWYHFKDFFFFFQIKRTRLKIMKTNFVFCIIPLGSSHQISIKKIRCDCICTQIKYAKHLLRLLKNVGRPRKNFLKNLNLRNFNPRQISVYPTKVTSLKN